MKNHYVGFLSSQSGQNFIKMFSIALAVLGVIGAAVNPMDSPSLPMG